MRAFEKCVFSIDVEDWFHILDVPSAPAISDWPSLPSRVERNLSRTLDLLSARKTTATCFFLGWIAEKFPRLVREAVQRGHEIASHGYAHRLSYEMTQQEFRTDVRRSRMLLEDIAGEPVIGYRAPGFSATSKTPWFFQELVEAGYQYDSSIFPAPRGHGGAPSSPVNPYWVAEGKLLEFPISVARLGGFRLCLFGGGYLRLFPYFLVQRAAKTLMEQGGCVNFYIHPREIDPEQPRLPMSVRRRFKTYVNLGTTENKLRNILRDFPVETFRDVMAHMKSELVSRSATEQLSAWQI